MSVNTIPIRDWKVGEYFEIDTRTLSTAPTIYGEILANPDNMFCTARVFSEAMPQGDEWNVSVLAPTRVLTRQEFENAKKKIQTAVEP